MVSHQEAGASAATSVMAQGSAGHPRQASGDYLPAEDCLVSGDRVGGRYVISGQFDADELATYHMARRHDARPGQPPHVVVVELPTSVRHRKDLAEIEESIRAASGVPSPVIDGLIEVIRSRGNRPLFVFPLPRATLGSPLFDPASLGPRDAVSLVLDVLEGLVALRDAGVFLESLTPSQIIVETEGSTRTQAGSPYRTPQPEGPARGRLGFLGLRRGARRPLDEMIRTSTWAGTPVFLAPEVIVPRGKPTAQTYVYSAGLCLYHALGGDFSHHEGVSPTALLLDISSRGTSLPDARPPHIDPELFAILRRAVAPERHRHASIEELADALRGYLSQEPRPAAAPSAAAAPPATAGKEAESGGLLHSIGKATRRLFGKK